MKHFISFRRMGDQETDHFRQKFLINDFRGWLEDNAGPEEVEWRWRRGDLVAQGVYIRDGQVAVAFKLKFNI